MMGTSAISFVGKDYERSQIFYVVCGTLHDVYEYSHDAVFALSDALKIIDPTNVVYYCHMFSSLKITKV